MHIRCPHCNNPIEILDNASLSDLSCPSCGSGFNILGDETIKVEGIAGDTDLPLFYVPGVMRVRIK